MGSLQAFCDAMRWAADSDRVGYSQSDRWGVEFYGGGHYNADCSSLVIQALRYAGFDTGSATYTGNMSAELCARGWTRYHVGAMLRAGDILLNDSCHVAAWLGDCIAQASIDENGNIAGGARGDQTGAEVNTCGYYDYPWDCVLRYEGDDEEDDMLRPADIWEYDYKGSAPGGNMYNCMLGLNSKLDELTKKVAALQADVGKIKTGGVDTAALAKAVNDDAARRMKA